jgi:hypothetical protein
MMKKLNHWGYYVMAIREAAYPSSWRWRIVCGAATPWIEGSGFSSHEAARLAGSLALADFLERLERERFRPD